MDSPFSEQRWTLLWGRLGAEPPGGVFANLVDRYREPGRHYHTAMHIAECLTHLDHFQHLAKNPDLVELALWLHDVIYDPRAGDNEAQSAAYTEDLLRQAGREELAPGVVSLIMATTHTEVLPADDAGLVVDLDLAVLAAPPEAYQSYCRAVRQEFSWVPEPLFRVGRQKVLRQLLEGGSIFVRREIADLWEGRAQTNVVTELRHLEGGAA